MLIQYVEKRPDTGRLGFFVYACTLCGKTHNQKPHAENHVESIHFPGTFVYPCKYCDQTFTGRNKMYLHVNFAHKRAKN